ncbi:hypothetical protein KQX54_011859 [Cotesia glomerata]|uniref:Uncharacterized protein n=1 Tax=Cotesia glomerata TaxID=32391 RepID=A0AAV7IT72_COTGL|nr:hypothetical protein KQX54_011859 [Cotesia glomerata]
MSTLCLLLFKNEEERVSASLLISRDDKISNGEVKWPGLECPRKYAPGESIECKLSSAECTSTYIHDRRVEGEDQTQNEETVSSVRTKSPG